MGGENPFEELFAQAGIEGSGQPAPEELQPEVKLQSVVLGFEHRTGKKVVTTVRDVPPPLREDTLRDLKQALGVGGAVQGSVLALQGDHRKNLTDWFESRGVRVRGMRGD